MAEIDAVPASMRVGTFLWKISGSIFVIRPPCEKAHVRSVRCSDALALGIGANTRLHGINTFI